MSSRRPRIAYLCSVFSDSELEARGIRGQALAPTAKIVRFATSAREYGKQVVLISLGRGRSQKSAYYTSRMSKIGSVPTIYCSFLSYSVFSHLVTTLSLLWTVVTILKRDDRVVIYNGLPHYLPAVAFARLCGIQVTMDLEDAAACDWRRPKEYFLYLTERLYLGWLAQEVWCANMHLANTFKHKNVKMFYGVLDAPRVKAHFNEKLIVVLTGALFRETGASLLLSALTVALARCEDLGRKLQVVVTGIGPAASEIERAAREELASVLEFRGQLPWSAYRELLMEADVGLSLKLPSSYYATATFPSKVIEYVKHGLVLVSFPLPDVEKLLGEDGYVRLESENEDALAEVLTRLDDERVANIRRAERAQKSVLQHLRPHAVVSDLLG